MGEGAFAERAAGWGWQRAWPPCGLQGCRWRGAARLFGQRRALVADTCMHWLYLLVVVVIVAWLRLATCGRVATRHIVIFRVAGLLLATLRGLHVVTSLTRKERTRSWSRTQAGGRVEGTLYRRMEARPRRLGVETPKVRRRVVASFSWQ